VEVLLFREQEQIESFVVLNVIEPEGLFARVAANLWFNSQINLEKLFVVLHVGTDITEGVNL